jgi:ATP-dependent Clp protease adaptor protein ClpS
MTTDLKSKDKVDVKPPSMFKVVIHNDDVTPMDLVIAILKKIFDFSLEKANDLTMEVHNSGNAVAGVYIYELAEQKSIEATAMAQINGSPLRITIEEDK